MRSDGIRLFVKGAPVSGSDPLAVLTMRSGKATLQTDDGQTTTTAYDDPLRPLESLVASRRAPEMPDLPLPRFTGGAVGYLSYEARHGIDWVWEHRLDDLVLLGL